MKQVHVLLLRLRAHSPLGCILYFSMTPYQERHLLADLRWALSKDVLMLPMCTRLLHTVYTLCLPLAIKIGDTFLGPSVVGLAFITCAIQGSCPHHTFTAITMFTKCGDDLFFFCQCKNKVFFQIPLSSP